MKQKSLFVSHKIILSFNIHSMQLCVRVEIEIYRFLKVKKKRYSDFEGRDFTLIAYFIH